MKRKVFTGFVSLSIILCFLFSGCASSQEITKPADQVAAQQEPSPPAAPPTSEKEASNPSNSSEQQAQETSNSPKEPATMPEEIGDRLAKTYNDMMASGKYFMKYRMTTDEETITAEIAYTGENFATKTVASGLETRMIIMGNKLYMIDPSTKTVMIMSSEAYEGEEDVDYAGLIFVKEGQGDFLGKTLPYEEYSADGTTIKYFFQGKKLVGMEMNYEGMIQVLEILELSESIPSGMFDIPKDYEQQNLG